jgi:hypothetical protein
MTSFRETTQQYAHRQNIARYRRLLDTNLTADERRFVERRVAEERAALRRLKTPQRMLQPSRSNNADSVTTVWERDEARWIAANIAKLQALLCSSVESLAIRFFRRQLTDGALFQSAQ